MEMKSREKSRGRRKNHFDADFQTSTEQGRTVLESNERYHGSADRFQGA